MMDSQINPKAQTELEVLRQQLKHYNAWPVAGDEFLALISQTNWRYPQPTNQDYAMLPEIVSDVISGMDIGAQYPAFFQKLLAHSSLRQEFLSALHQAGNS